MPQQHLSIAQPHSLRKLSLSGERSYHETVRKSKSILGLPRLTSSEKQHLSLTQRRNRLPTRAYIGGLLTTSTELRQSRDRGRLEPIRRGPLWTPCEYTVCRSLAFTPEPLRWRTS